MMLYIWTVYDHPRDYPDHWVARKWVVKAGGYGPTTEVVLAHNVEDIREEMEGRGLTCLPRQEGDDRVIVESWI